MRILHVTDAYPPRLGGIEAQVRDLAVRQAALGHEVDVLTRAGTGTPPQDSAGPNPTVHRTGLVWLNLAGTNHTVHELLAGRRPDVVHAHLSVLSPLAILAVRAAVRRRVPVVVTVHSLWWWASGLYRFADRLLGWGGWPVHWTAVSDLAAQPLRRIIGSRAEVGVLRNGIDQPAWRIERAGEDAGAAVSVSGSGGELREIVLISVIRLALRKRPRALLRIVRDVHSRLPEGQRLRMVVVGDGPQRRAMTRRIRRFDLVGVVELVGCKERPEIRELYRRADIYLAPAILESFGIAALEARCAGLPIVARHHTGITDFVGHRVNGLLADTDDGLVEAVLELAGSPALRREIVVNNSQPVPSAGWPDVLQSADLCYKSARESLTR